MTAKQARQGFVSMCACTEPVRIGIGAVCVAYGQPKWPITMLNHTNKHPWYRMMFGFSFLAPYARTTRYEEAFFSLDQGRKARFARAPHSNFRLVWESRARRPGPLGPRILPRVRGRGYSQGETGALPPRVLVLVAPPATTSG